MTKFEFITSGKVEKEDLTKCIENIVIKCINNFIQEQEIEAYIEVSNFDYADIREIIENSLNRECKKKR